MNHDEQIVVSEMLKSSRLKYEDIADEQKLLIKENRKLKIKCNKLISQNEKLIERNDKLKTFVKRMEKRLKVVKG